MFTFFLRTRVGLHNLVESCDLSGPFVINDAHTSFNQPCMHWDGHNREADYPDLPRVLDDLYAYIDAGDVDRPAPMGKESSRQSLLRLISCARISCVYPCRALTFESRWQQSKYLGPGFE